MNAENDSGKSTSVFLRAAQEYLKHGWSPVALCPADHAEVDAAHERTCVTPGCTPLWPWTEYQHRLPSERVLAIYWNRNRLANVGIALGAVSGLVAVVYERFACEALPETLEVVGPGSRQLLYALPAQTEVPNGDLQLPDNSGRVRCLSMGSCAVLPPSRHAGGGEYLWRTGCAPQERSAAPLPKWILDELLATKAREPPPTPPGPQTVSPPPPERSTDRESAPRIIVLDEVQTSAARWLWPGWIPLGKLTVLDGDPGLGKSTLLLDLAARVTRGLAMPDGSAGMSGGVTLLTAEDSLGDTVRPRLEAAGADLARVRSLSAVGDADGGDRPPTIPRDIDILRRMIQETGSRLLILDPFLAYLSGGVDGCNEQDVRRCLHRLAELAEATGCAVVLLRHLNKLSGGKAIYRGAGSIGIIAAARSGLLVARDPDSEDHRVLACTKSNLTAMPVSLRFFLEGAAQSVCRLIWHGNSLYQADELIAQTEAIEERCLVNDAARFLSGLLSEGPVSAEECLRQARAVGIREKTLRRAKSRLRIRSIRDGDGVLSHWLWGLPTT
ncbi:MAG TPA: AAA family ATPase [Gemmataceae bacterium]|nr:AAA family ATPase [Gemmataceae bacterium]